MRFSSALGPLLAGLLLTSACGEWSGAPVTSAEPTAIPLGPGPVTTVARGAPAASIAIDAWGTTVVVAWVEGLEREARAAVMAAASADAGASFAAPVLVGRVLRPADRTPGSLALAVGVAAPSPASRAGTPQVWVRAAWDGPAQPTVWHSRDAGRRFADLDARQQVPATAFPRPWGRADRAAPLAPGTLAIGTDPAAQYAVPLPAGASGDPLVVVDDHGALALLWRERDDTGRDALVVRRAWVDWNAGSGAAPGFDAAYRLATFAGEPSARALARIPGGVIVSWTDRGDDGRPAVFARRLGMDMTCTRESAIAPATP